MPDQMPPSRQTDVVLMRRIVVSGSVMRALKVVADAHGFTTVEELMEFVGLKIDKDGE